MRKRRLQVCSDSPKFTEMQSRSWDPDFLRSNLITRFRLCSLTFLSRLGSEMSSLIYVTDMLIVDGFGLVSFITHSSSLLFPSVFIGLKQIQVCIPCVLHSGWHLRKVQKCQLNAYMKFYGDYPEEPWEVLLGLWTHRHAGLRIRETFRQIVELESKTRNPRCWKGSQAPI